MNLHPIVERLLEKRGICAEEREEFLDPSLARLVRVDALPGVREAAEVILPFVRDGRKIVVYGDYDCDGVCASAILVSALRRIGALADAFVPDRFKEGYGLTAAAIRRLFSEHPDVGLVVTVDNGISSVREIADIKARGVSVVVTDHHLPGPDLPVADALVNPRVAAAPGCADLCGAGVAFFLAGALVQAAQAAGLYSGGKFAAPLLVLAGLATVADIMPLRGQNRILVAQSLANFWRCAPLGLKELMRSASRVASSTPNARDYGFLLSPRINATGRLESAALAYNLLMEQDREVARNLAVRVNGINGRRQTEERELAFALQSQIASGRPACVARLETGNTGVVGIVAARLMERLGVPVAVAVGDTGSVRAPDGYNVRDALAAATDALDRFGGHAAAGGFTVKEGRFDDFRRLFTEACAAQYAEAREAIERAKAVEPDLWLEPGDITMELLDALNVLEPFGEGNPEPVFGLRGVRFSDARPIGAEGQHATFAFVNKAIPRAVWWNHGVDVEAIRAHDVPRDVLFTLMESDFGGDSHLELKLLAVRVHGQ
ncbi:MAG: DHH family phosphoesterase [Kiritimatiellae bacterium]|nr:DHH family phosphoesterase [Kiritimatiellia bacterium]